MASSLFKQSSKLLRYQLSLSSTALRRVPTGILPPLLCRSYVSDSKVRSPFDSNIIRILRTEIDYQYEYGPPDQPSPCFNSFSVEERPGEQFVRLRRKFGENEDIKVEATMFDGCVTEPKAGDDNDGEDIRLHISLLVDICKGEESDGLGFVCSAWPDGLEIMKAYIFRSEGLQPKAHMGPNICKLNPELRKALHDFLAVRGVNDELSFFLHHYMVNKDRAELLRWLDSVKSFVEL